MTDPVGASLPGAAPRNPREVEQLARLKARDLDGFVAVLLESVRLFADTEAGRQGMGSPVLAAVVYAGIERQIAMLVGAALGAPPATLDRRTLFDLFIRHRGLVGAAHMADDAHSREAWLAVDEMEQAAGAALEAGPPPRRDATQELLITIVRCVRKYPDADEVGVAAYIRALVEEVQK